MTKKMLQASVLLLCLIGVVCIQPVWAAIYKYVDRDGILNFADDLQSVPAEYRASAKIAGSETETNGPSVTVKEKQPQKQPDKIEAAPVQAVPTVVTAPMNQKPAAPTRGWNRFLVSTIVIVSALFAFSILTILDKSHKKSMAVARMVILWVTSVFLIVAHAGDVVGLFNKAGDGLTAAQSASAEKGQKAVKAMKQLNELMEQVGQVASDPAGADGEKKE